MLPPMLDVEVLADNGAKALIANVDLWLKAVEAALGCTPFVYSDVNFWREHIRPYLSQRVPLWLADYAAVAAH